MGDILRVKINKTEYELPPLTAPTMRQMKQLAGIPMSEMRPMQIVRVLVALAAGVSLEQSETIWEKQIEDNGEDATKELIGDISAIISQEVERRLEWIKRRRPAVRRAWVQAFQRGV